MNLPATVKPDIDEATLVVLARDMAWNVRDPLIILDAIGINWEQFHVHVKTNPFYKRAYETFLLEWESASTTNKRIAIKSAAALEDSLPHLGAKLVDAKESLPAKTEAAKLFARLAGAGEEKKDYSSGEKFVITINLGNDKIRLEDTIRAEIDGIQVQQITETPRLYDGISETAKRTSEKTRKSQETSPNE